MTLRALAKVESRNTLAERLKEEQVLMAEIQDT
jgi:hypothetical protein